MPLSIKVDNLSPGMLEISVYPASIDSPPWISSHMCPLPLSSWPSGMVQARCHQPGNEIQRLKDHMRGAVPVRRLELIVHVPMPRERQPLFGHCRAVDVAAQVFELHTFVGPGRYPGMQAKTCHLADPVIKWLITSRQCL